MGQIPIYFGQRGGGRPADPANSYSSRYIDESNEPLFAFGHGLSYTRFSISNLRVSPESAARSATLEINVEVQNVGSRRGEETLFLFARRLRGRVAPPLLELHGVGKIVLEPGARGTLTLHLPVAQLRSLGPDLEPVLEPGELEILIGPSADRACLLAGRLTLVA